ncbi:MAG: asparaginase, partial [Planctomycetes bacterium]|nr:asparaginase [Planctomycetota bacterium]
MKIMVVTTGGTIAKTYDEADGALRNERPIVESILGALRLPDLEITYRHILSKDSLDLTDNDRELIVDTVAEAVDKHGATGSVLTVPPAFTRDAVFEAIDNGIKLLVIVTERIPRFEVAQMAEFATMHGARIIGPNCLGLITPEKCKMGGIGGPAADTRKAYMPGPVGVMSRSGGMTTEIANALTAAGLGQSTAVSIGG